LAEQYYRIIAETVRDCVIVLDDEKQIVFANSAADALFGSGLVGKNFVSIIRHPECLDAINSILEGKSQASATISLERGYRLMLHVNVVDLGSDNSDGARVAVNLNDISHVYVAEQMRSDFVANVSHELRSPLTALSGFIETLLGTAKDDEAARVRFLGMMQDEAARMVRLISDLLSLSKVEANQRVRPKDQVDLNSVIRRVAKNLEPQAETGRKKIILDLENSSGAVLGNEDELIQVFQNLLENSIKYGSPDSEIRISVTGKEQMSGIEGPALVVTLTDKSEGIARHHIARLTERFYRVDNSRSRAMGGTGLGLAIVKHIVGRHRGRLLIESKEGSGSTFRVALPASSRPEPGDGTVA